MSANEITMLVQSVGFPIVCCAALFWYMIKQDEKHEKETEALRTAIDNNTNIITKLYERLTGGKNE